MRRTKIPQSVSRMHPGAKARTGFLRIAVLLLVAWAPFCASAQSGTSPANPAAPEVIQRMVQQNAIRAEHLKYFTSVRRYHVEFHGLGKSLIADMQARVTYNAASGKSFQIINESGSHLLINHVLRKLLETEQDDSRTQKAALTPANYNFQLQSTTAEDGRKLYIFSVEPKVKNKLLYRGRIWIDGDDYAVVRVEAQPAENPSFWIKNTDIHHVYARTGEFWLPQTNRSESKIRLGGSALLTIDYGTYQFEQPRGITPTEVTEVAHKVPLDVR